jgi:hypothetical protein
VVANLREKVDASREAVPVVAALRNAALKERHWVKIQAAVGSEIARTEGVTLGSVLAQEVLPQPRTVVLQLLMVQIVIVDPRSVASNKECCVPTSSYPCSTCRWMPFRT